MCAEPDNYTLVTMYPSVSKEKNYKRGENK